MDSDPMGEFCVCNRNLCAAAPTLRARCADASTSWLAEGGDFGRSCCRGDVPDCISALAVYVDRSTLTRSRRARRQRRRPMSLEQTAYVTAARLLDLDSDRSVPVAHGYIKFVTAGHGVVDV